MTQSQLDRSVAEATGEDPALIRHLGFSVEPGTDIFSGEAPIEVPEAKRLSNGFCDDVGLPTLERTSA